MEMDFENADGDKSETHGMQVSTGGLAADKLRSVIERIERLEEERTALASDVKDIFAEAKSGGFDVKVIRMLLKIRKQPEKEVEEQETLLDLYRRTLGEK